MWQKYVCLTRCRFYWSVNHRSLHCLICIDWRRAIWASHALWTDRNRSTAENTVTVKNDNKIIQVQEWIDATWLIGTSGFANPLCRSLLALSWRWSISVSSKSLWDVSDGNWVKKEKTLNWKWDIFMNITMFVIAFGKEKSVRLCVLYIKNNTIETIDFKSSIQKVKLMS